MSGTISDGVMLVATDRLNATSIVPNEAPATTPVVSNGTAIVNNL